jgi:hypothetical protein
MTAANKHRLWFILLYLAGVISLSAIAALLKAAMALL